MPAEGLSWPVTADHGVFVNGATLALLLLLCLLMDGPGCLNVCLTNTFPEVSGCRKFSLTNANDLPCFLLSVTSLCLP